MDEEIQIDPSITYVHEGGEVHLTGRTATRTTRRQKVETLYEIEPADEEIRTWKKWIQFGELFKIDEVQQVEK